MLKNVQPVQPFQLIQPSQLIQPFQLFQLCSQYIDVENMLKI